MKWDQTLCAEINQILPKTFHQIHESEGFFNVKKVPSFSKYDNVGFHDFLSTGCGNLYPFIKKFTSRLHFELMDYFQRFYSKNSCDPQKVIELLAKRS